MATKNKFGLYFRKSRVQEWRFVYIDYELLRSMLEPFQETAKIYIQRDEQGLYQMGNRMRNNLMLPADLEKRLNDLEESFVSFYMTEMEKANQFYNLHIQQVKLKYKKLQYNLIVLNELRYGDPGTTREQKILTKNYYILRTSTKAIYKEVFLLLEFCTLNQKAFTKLTQSYQKKAFFIKRQPESLKKINKQKEKLSVFQETNTLNQLMTELENLYINTFSRNDPNLGIEVLRAERKERIFTFKNQFLFGFFFGICSCIFLSIFINRLEFMSSQGYNSQIDKYFPMFRGLGLFIMYFWLLAVNIFIWEKTHINYKQIFRYNYHHSSVYQISKRICFFTMIFLLIFLLSLLKEMADLQEKQGIPQQSSYVNFIFPPQIGPLIIWFVIIFYMIMPTRKVCNAQGRKYFWRLMLHCLISAAFPMSFPVSWATDQFVSFVGPLKDVDYTICFYYTYFSTGNEPDSQAVCSNSKNIVTGLLIACFPLVLRMIQCYRQGYDKGKFFGTDEFYNFLKYTCSLTTAVLSFSSNFWMEIRYIWIFSATISMIYSYYWDVTKDWKFFQPDTKYRFLRRQLAYDWPQFYYAIMLLNIVLRLSWTLSISPSVSNMFQNEWISFTFIVSFLEIFRRFLWNFIRVEKEHVVNMGEFRAVPEVTFPFEARLKRQMAESKAYRDSAGGANGFRDSQQEVINRSEKTTIIGEDSGIRSPTMSNLTPSGIGNDIYQDKYFQLQELEQKFLMQYEQQETEEEVFRATFGEFQKKVERLHVDYPELVSKHKREVKDVKNYIFRVSRGNTEPLLNKSNKVYND